MSHDHLTDHRLTIHIFAVLEGERGENAHELLEQLWLGCIDQLEIDQPAGAYPSAPGLPRSRLDGIIAVRRANSEALREVWWTNERGMACLSINLSRVGSPDSGWSALQQEWDSLARGLDLSAAVGIVEIITALTPDIQANADFKDRSSGVRANLDASYGITAEWDRSAARAFDHIVMWQLASWTDGLVRRLVVTAPVAYDEQMGDWIWGTPHLAPMTRYLLNAAKLNYLAGVLADDSDWLRRHRKQAEDMLHRLRPVLTAVSGASEEDLHKAQQDLSNLQADEAGLVDALISVGAMRRSAQISAANMAALAAVATGGPAETGPLDFFSLDQSVAQTLDQDLDDHAAYLKAASERAKLFASVADREIGRRLQRDAAIGREQQEKLTLMQTAIIGAVLMALTAIQAFGYQIPLPAPLKPAVIAMLGATVLWLSAIALRISQAGASRSDALGKRAFASGAAGAVGASTGWVGAALVPGHRAWLTWGLVIAGIVLGCIASWWTTGRTMRVRQ